jgi:hypothetical protein
MKLTHELIVRIASSNRLHLKIRFGSKAEAFLAAQMILVSNPNRYFCEIVYIGI